MDDSDLSRLTITQALEVAKQNEDLSIKVKKLLEGKLAEVLQKYQSMPDSFIPDEDEYSVLSFYRERMGDNDRYEQVSRRFWKHHRGAADETSRSPGASFIKISCLLIACPNIDVASIF